MEAEKTSAAIEFDGRLRRSQGRTGRTFAATAKVTRDELSVLEAAARSSGKALSEWSRDALLREARHGKNDQLRDALVTELVAVRMLMVNLLKPLLLGQKASPESIAEIMAVVRREKHKTAREVMEQYTAVQPQEKC